MTGGRGPCRSWIEVDGDELRVVSHSIRLCAAVFVLFLFTVATASGQQPEADSPKKSIVLPFEIDYDSGADNGNALISRFIPVNSFYVRERWKLVNVAMIIAADAPGGVPVSPGNPDPVPGPKAFGLGDLTEAIFYTPTKSKGLLWGVGVAVGIPTATDDVLGSGKWLAGPAFRLGHQAGPWRFGMLATNRWSFAGGGPATGCVVRA